MKALMCLLALSLCGVAAALEKTWNFDADKAGAAPEGFSVESGSWAVKAGDASSNPNALAQTAKSDNNIFNIAVAKDVSLKDVDISVKFKAVAGETDQGGGVVWRYKDAKNYYIARYNPLEFNYRLYHILDGKRTQLQGVNKLILESGWHTLCITMSGDKIECFLDDKKHLEATDATFKDAGTIGLWTKADAETLFDDLKISGN
jgi:hypothetical protein